jgi:predicted nucleic acid-binding protein
VILIDTSAWVEFLRGTGSSTCDEVDRLLDRESAVTDVVVMEVLAGARDDGQLRDLRGLLGRSLLLSCEAADYLEAARLYRTCRNRGKAVRRLVDCLIAAVAIRSDVPILHADRDFDVLAEFAGLRIHPS